MSNQSETSESDDETFKRGFINATQVTAGYLGKLDKAVKLKAMSFWLHETDSCLFQYSSGRRRKLGWLRSRNGNTSTVCRPQLGNTFKTIYCADYYYPQVKLKPPWQCSQAHGLRMHCRMCRGAPSHLCLRKASTSTWTQSDTRVFGVEISFS